MQFTVGASETQLRIVYLEKDTRTGSWAWTPVERLYTVAIGNTDGSGTDDGSSDGSDTGGTDGSTGGGETDGSGTDDGSTTNGDGNTDESSTDGGNSDGSGTDSGGSTDGGGTDGGESSTQDTLADLTCSTDQVAKFNGTAWACADDNDTDFLNEAGCAPGELLRATESEGWECVSSADTATAEDCPPLYLSELSRLDNLLEPSVDHTGNLSSISKTITPSAAPQWESEICIVEWSYHPDDSDADRVRHTFQRNFSPNGDFSPEMEAESYFNFIVNYGGLNYEIQIDYEAEGHSSSENDANAKTFAVTSKQLDSCAVLAGCDLDSY